MYYTLYALLSTYIYGADAVLTGDQTLTLTLLSTFGVVFLVALPFLVVYWIVRQFV